MPVIVIKMPIHVHATKFASALMKKYQSFFSHGSISAISHFLKIIPLCGLLLGLLLSEVFGQNPYEQGRSYYEARAAEADSFRADTANINKAIEAFNQAIDQNIQPENSATYLLQSYYFKGMYTDITEEQQKEVHDKGRILGEEMIEKFPDSVPIKFWYGANLGRWAEVHGFIKAATSGIAQKLRRICNDIIKLDPEYQGGGGYRILAQVHYYSPSIPLLMSWPSKDKARKLIENAMEIAPSHPPNRLLYAQILIEFNRKEEAEEHLQYIQNMELRPTHIVEDRYMKHRSSLLLKEHF